MKYSLDNHYLHRKLTTLVENCTVYYGPNAQLSIIETFKSVEKIGLTFDNPIIVNMNTGNKTMRIGSVDPFDVVPGETVIIPPREQIFIDFPDSSLEKPTQCLALALDINKIKDVVDKFNFTVEIENENNQWSLAEETAHLLNNTVVDDLVGRMAQTFINPTASKDILLDIMMEELVIRLLQTKARQSLFQENDEVYQDNRIGFAVKYIKENLTNQDLTIDILAHKACMSTSHFHKKFKNTLGISPIEYINTEKIKFAQKLIRNRKDLRITDVAYMSGFNNISYFNRQFKRFVKMSPQQYKKRTIPNQTPYKLEKQAV